MAGSRPDWRVLVLSAGGFIGACTFYLKALGLGTWFGWMQGNLGCSTSAFVGFDFCLSFSIFSILACAVQQMRVRLDFVDAAELLALFIAFDLVSC